MACPLRLIASGILVYQESTDGKWPVGLDAHYGSTMPNIAFN